MPRLFVLALLAVLVATGCSTGPPESDRLGDLADELQIIEDV